MSVQITVSDVPEAIRDELKTRAALKGQSMQEYLRREFAAIVAYPPREQWLEEVRASVMKAGKRISTEDILHARDAGRH